MDEFTKIIEFSTELNCYLAKEKHLQDDLSLIRSFLPLFCGLKIKMQ